ncbi:MAG: hypothetical protein EXS31_03210 [Pedosphaera sp.]|nr:hypothetical protein [Pedosphaera sp.]
MLTLLCGLFAPLRDSVAASNGIKGDARYTVTGQAFYFATLGTGRFVYDFTLTVSNSSWAMEFEEIPSTKMRRMVQICQSSNLVSMQYWNKRHMPGGSNDGYVMVDHRRVPVDSPSAAHAVFVGFAGQLYLPAGTKGLLHPLWHPDREVSQKPFVRSEWELIAPNSHLAAVIRCQYEAGKWNETLDNGRAVDKSTESEKRALAAIYRSFGRTNFLGEMFPIAYAFTAFAPDREDGRDKNLPVYEITVTNVVLRPSVANKLFDLRFKGKAVVEDFRGAQRTYTITNAAPSGL